MKNSKSMIWILVHLQFKERKFIFCYLILTAQLYLRKLILLSEIHTQLWRCWMNNFWWGSVQLYRYLICHFSNLATVIFRSAVIHILELIHIIYHCHFYPSYYLYICRSLHLTVISVISLHQLIHISKMLTCLLCMYILHGI